MFNSIQSCSKPSHPTSTNLTQTPGVSTNNNVDDKKTEPTVFSDGDEFFDADIDEQLQQYDEIEKQHRESMTLATSMKMNQTSLGEAAEKRNHRSLIDSLDQSYIENPPKMKRETTPQPWLGEYDQIIVDLKKPVSENGGDSQQIEKIGNGQLDELEQSLKVFKESISHQNDSEHSGKLGNERNGGGNEGVSDNQQDSGDNQGKSDDFVDGEKVKSPSTSTQNSPHDKHQKRIQEFFKAKPKKMASDETESK